VAFVVLCDGFLGIELHFKLWRYFFAVSVHKRVEREKGKKREFKVPVGSASIRLRGNWAVQYMSLSLMMSNKGWHK
jgi:hypothetical protein